MAIEETHVRKSVKAQLLKRICAETYHAEVYHAEGVTSKMMLKQMLKVLVFLGLLGAALVRALHVVDLLRPQLARPRDRLLEACAHVQAVAV